MPTVKLTIRERWRDLQCWWKEHQWVKVGPSGRRYCRRCGLAQKRVFIAKVGKAGIYFKYKDMGRLQIPRRKP